MEIPQTFNEFKTIINNPSTSPLFLIEIHVQEFVQYLSKNGDSIEEEPRGPFMVESFYLSSHAMIGAPDDNLCEILSSIANSGRPVLPIVLLIAVNSWDPTPRGAPEN
ncbi:hypothetical protein H5410_018074 [Solanum commersonii]|uniref:Uncharacterized protein n=1 Tax=Solanum commersonii TaxID=4109 RepID=A0A9J6A1S3_SOLCO|nr:hypothetical protein H5410_018074 [Solanum commersonii]